MSKWKVDFSQGDRKLTRYYNTADEAIARAADESKKGWAVEKSEEMTYLYPNPKPEDANYFPFELQVTSDGETWTVEAKFKDFIDAMYSLHEKCRTDHREMKVHRVERGESA